MKQYAPPTSKRAGIKIQEQSIISTQIQIQQKSLQFLFLLMYNQNKRTLLHRSSAVVLERKRSGAAVVGASHLVVRGSRSSATQGRSKPPIAVLGLPLRELRVLANYR
jgi:hypothetical protein